MNSKLILAFAVFAVVTVSIQARSIKKRQAIDERPEAPWLLECDEPGDNRENCYSQDPANHENYRVFLQEVEDWEKKNPEAAKTFSSKNPDKKKEEQEKFQELEQFLALHYE